MRATARRPLSRRSIEVPATVGAPAAARSWAAWLDGYLDARAREDLRLALSELVSNAVQHSGMPAGAPIALTATVYADRVAVTVRDGGVGIPPLALAPDAPTGGGIGLALARQVTRRLAIDGPRGTISFEVSRQG